MRTAAASFSERKRAPCAGVFAVAELELELGRTDERVADSASAPFAGDQSWAAEVDGPYLGVREAGSSAPVAIADADGWGQVEGMAVYSDAARRRAVAVAAFDEMVQKTVVEDAAREN